MKTCRGVAQGWHRAFTVRLLGFRGTADRPGLMLALARGGRCVGLLLRAAEGAEAEVVFSLVRRELPYREFRDMVRWISVDTERGKVKALVFWAGRFAPADASGLDDAEVAETIAGACGYGGSCAEYLYETLAGLERHGIRDRNLWRLQALVAEAITRRSETPAAKAFPHPRCRSTLRDREVSDAVARQPRVAIGPPIAEPSSLDDGAMATVPERLERRPGMDDVDAPRESARGSLDSP